MHPSHVVKILYILSLLASEISSKRSKSSTRTLSNFAMSSMVSNVG